MSSKNSSSAAARSAARRRRQQEARRRSEHRRDRRGLRGMRSSRRTGKQGIGRVDERLNTKRYDVIWQAMAPLAYATPSSTIDYSALMHAVQRLPLIRWLNSQMMHVAHGPTGVDRSLACAVLWLMGAMPGERPVIQHAMRKLTVDDRATWWMLGCPRPIGRTQLYEHIEVMLTNNDPWACQCVALALHDLLAELFPGKPTRDKGFPRMALLTYASADGSYIRHHAPSHVNPAGRIHAAEVWGNRKKVGYMARTKKKGSQHHTHLPGPVTNLVDLVDSATTTPFIWDTFNPRLQERNPVLDLLSWHFDMKPDSPLWALVGDKHFDSETFLVDCEVAWGVHPVAILKDVAQADWQDGRADGYVRDLDQPECDHGPMKLAQWDGVWDARRRAREGVKRGEIPNPTPDPFSRWVCAHRLCNHTAYNRMWDYPRMFPVIGHQGDHDLALLRLALQARRNSSESAFASLRRSGAGQKVAMHAPAWIKSDREVDRLIGVRRLFEIAGRLVIENGMYAESLEEGRRLGLLAEDAGRRRHDNSTRDEIADANAAHRRVEPEQPPTWERYIRGDAARKPDTYDDDDD
jgi:hypothetical protein